MDGETETRDTVAARPGLDERPQPPPKREALTLRERAVKDFRNEVFHGHVRVAKSKFQEEDSEARSDVSEGRSIPDLKRSKTVSNGEDAGAPETVATRDPARREAPAGRGKGEESLRVGTTFDTSMELNIVCGSGEEPSRVSVRSSARSLLVVAPLGEPDGERKCRGSRGAPVKIGSPATPPGSPPPPAAETVYEFTDDQPDNSEKLSSFRRRRLAEKKYEFCEEGEDAENIVPFRLLRRRDTSPRLACRRRAHEDAGDVLADPRSPDVQPVATGESDKTVLRPLNRNLVAITLLSPREAERDWTKLGVKKLSSEGIVADGGIQKLAREDAAGQPGNGRARCTIQFKRRYIEVDDELMSTTTEIEDDDCTGSAPYHFALPLEIHGAGYVQLQMISNSKAEKLTGVPGVMVHQMSFDVEAFCHEVAERLCEAAGKKYCFCIDYDVEIVDVCPLTGDVLVLAIMRIEAIVVSKGLAKNLRRGEILVGGQRNQYQGGCTFLWNTNTGLHKIVNTSPLMESSVTELLTAEPWGPAKSLVRTLRDNFPQVPMCHAVRSISNRPVFADESYKCLSDLDNLIDLVL